MDSGCTFILIIMTVLVMHQFRVSLTGHRYPSCGLWSIDIPATTPDTHVASMPTTRRPVGPITNITTAPAVPRNTAAIPCTSNLIAFLKDTAGSPDLSMWTKAINVGNFSTCSGLTSALVRKHPPQYVATLHGHLNHIRGNLHLTQPPALTTHLPRQLPNEPQPTITDQPHGHTCYIYTNSHPVSASMPTTRRPVGPITNITTAPAVPRNTAAIPCTSNLIAFLKDTAGSPDLSMWTKAINVGNFSTCSGLTSALVRKHPPQYVATLHGHLNHIRGNLHLTQPPALTPHLPRQLPNKPQPTITDQPHGRTCYIYTNSHPVSGYIATDLPGQFPTIFSRDTKYLLILYVYKSNAILADPMHTRRGPEHLAAYQRVNQSIIAHGL